MSITSDHQFGEMKRRLGAEGGFTYDPRKRSFVTEGYSVAAHSAAELRVPISRRYARGQLHNPAAIETVGGAKESHLQGYVAGSAPLWKQQKAKDRGQEMIGGWRSDNADVLDIPKVFPATPAGHTKSRQAQVLRNQEASYSLHEDAEDPNPWFTGSEATPPAHAAAAFPEFANVVRKNPAAALDPEKYPETASWADQPMREAGFAKEARIKGRRAAQAQ